MASLYLHIPFCQKACHYCNFHFSTQRHQIGSLVDALKKEIALRKDYFSKKETLTSIYFGGGTPSIVPVKMLGDLIDSIQQAYRIKRGAEITLEANPEDVNKNWLRQITSLGINRLSLGVQSFSDVDLVYLGRLGCQRQSISAVEMILASDISQLSLDLIYGMPTLSLSRWKAHLKRVFRWKLPHFSCYALTLEESTPLHKKVEQNKIAAPPEELSQRQFSALMDEAINSGYEHYEISNFARDNLYSQHNLIYWQGEKYLGLGPSAHSYDLLYREWNVSDNRQYIEQINEGIIPNEREVVTAINRFNERMMLQLRMQWGVDLKKLKERFLTNAREENLSPEIRDNFLTFFFNLADKLNDWQRQKMITFNEEDHLLLTSKGKLWADAIIRELFFIDG